MPEIDLFLSCLQYKCSSSANFAVSMWEIRFYLSFQLCPEISCQRHSICSMCSCFFSAWNFSSNLSSHSHCFLLCRFSHLDGFLPTLQSSQWWLFFFAETFFLLCKIHLQSDRIDADNFRFFVNLKLNLCALERAKSGNL